MMSTTTAMHLKVQRSRFRDHTLTSLAGFLPAIFQWAKPVAGKLQPVEPVPRDASREAAEVRRMADAYMQTDPGFAADLYAAADRHEQLAIS